MLESANNSAFGPEARPLVVPNRTAGFSALQLLFILVACVHRWFLLGKIQNKILLARYIESDDSIRRVRVASWWTNLLPHNNFGVGSQSVICSLFLDRPFVRRERHNEPSVWHCPCYYCTYLLDLSKGTVVLVSKQSQIWGVSYCCVALRERY